MNYLLKAIILLVFISFGTGQLWAQAPQQSISERNYFQFEVPNYETQRQGGQTVSIYVRFAYKKGLPSSEYVDYRLMRALVLTYMEPSTEYPAELFWEILATAMGRELMKKYPIEGVSIQLIVLDNQDPNAFEPGDHGPIYTAGNILPMDTHR